VKKRNAGRLWKSTRRQTRLGLLIGIWALTLQNGAWTQRCEPPDGRGGRNLVRKNLSRNNRNFTDARNHCQTSGWLVDGQVRKKVDFLTTFGLKFIS